MDRESVWSFGWLAFKERDCMQKIECCVCVDMYFVVLFQYQSVL